jgi:hypothetical protein
VVPRPRRDMGPADLSKPSGEGSGAGSTGSASVRRSTTMARAEMSSVSLRSPTWNHLMSHPIFSISYA